MLMKWEKAVAVFTMCLGLFAGNALAQGTLRFCLRSEPKTFDPLKVEDDASVAVRYLTGGVLVRLNRQTQALETGTGAVLESVQGREADHLQTAQRSSFLRRHTVFCGRCRLHRATTDGSRVTFGHGRCVPLRSGQR